MKKNYIIASSLLLTIGAGGGSFCFAQSPARTSMMLQSPVAGTVPLYFNANADISKFSIPTSPVIWGMDTAWDSADNVTRGTNYIGKDIMLTGRVSFQPSDLVDANGNLSAAQQRTLQSRLNHIALSGTKNININCDHEVLMNKDNFPNCDQNYANYHGKPQEWVKVIKATMKYCQNKGFNVVSVSPFNEPDYTAWKEGSKSDFAAIAKLISEDPDFAGVRICGGNTLNCDQALSWYNALKPYVTEGNTHQLAGSFDSYANFWQTVRKDGNYATADELHNTMEAFVATHYGMQSGIWWGYDGVCRGEFCRASYYGKEIGYAENRKTWTAGAVYKRPEGKIDAFLGGSERQANTATYELIATDRPVYYDTKGPLYNYSMEIPGGTGYQNGQTNAERYIQVNYGADVPLEPIEVEKDYVIMNPVSMMCMQFLAGSTADGTNIVLGKYTNTASNKYQQWRLTAVDSRVGGDFSYYVIRSTRNPAQVFDIKNWSTSSGGSIIAYSGGIGTNEQWVFEYAGNGDYYIRSRHSGLYLGVTGDRTTAGSAIQQQTFSGKPSQRWRLMPTNAALETTKPKVTTEVKAVAEASSIHLTWTKSASLDVAGYTVLRGFKTNDATVADENGMQWDVIARIIPDCEFLDNCAAEGVEYTYIVKTVDKSRNMSDDSEGVVATVAAKPALVARYVFEDSMADETQNFLEGVTAGKANYSAAFKHEGAKALYLNGTDAFAMLPVKVGAMKTMTIGMWVYNTSTSTNWTRIFDFGNGTDKYMFLTPSNGSEMRFVMKNGGSEQILSASKLATGWKHVMVTIGDENVTLYVDGVEKAKTGNITLRPTDIMPVMNYLGKSQFAADPLFKGYMDDVRIYNYELSSDEVKLVFDGEEPTAVAAAPAAGQKDDKAAIYTLDGVRHEQMQSGVNIVNNKKYFK